MLDNYTITLDNLYKASSLEMPSPGRYTVSMKTAGFWRIILEKTINVVKNGQNHLPTFFLRQFNIPFMDFKVVVDTVCKEIVFIYNNGVITDRLRKRKSKNEWIGKIFYKGQFLDYFILRRK